jgi:hypothetical protein
MNVKAHSPTIQALVCLSALGTAGLAYTQQEAHQFEARLSGAQEVVVGDTGAVVPGGTDSTATGKINVRFTGAFAEVTVNLPVTGLTGTFAAAHFHCGAPGENGPIVFGLQNPGPLLFDGRRIAGTLTNADFTGADCVEVIGRPVNNLVALAIAMRDGLIYANVHSDIFPAGEIRGQMLERGN